MFFSHTIIVIALSLGNADQYDYLGTRRSLRRHLTLVYVVFFAIHGFHLDFPHVPVMILLSVYYLERNDWRRILTSMKATTSRTISCNSVLVYLLTE